MAGTINLRHGLDPGRQDLLAPVASLDGVTEGSARALDRLEISNVLDLAQAPVFVAALTIARADRGEADAAVVGGRLPRWMIDSRDADRPAADLLASPTTVLRMVGDHVASILEEELGLRSVRDLATYPPFLAARSAFEGVSEAQGRETLDPGTPLDLLPGAVDSPTDVHHFDAAVVFDAPGGAGDKLTVLDLGATNKPTEQPRLGALLRYRQAWHREGFALGHLVHSVALAPGESTNIAVVDWTRREAASSTESEEQSEQLRARMSQARALSETASSVANEVQNGFSQAFSHSMAEEWGRADPNTTQSDGSGLTMAVSSSRSQGERSVAASTAQKINEATQQAASSARARRATVVREVSQTEREEITTRTLTNYNHMHALTVQYHEVLQLYRTQLDVVAVEGLLFVPMKGFDFTDDSVVRRYRRVLADAARDSYTRDLILGFNDGVQVDFRATRASEASYDGDAKTVARARAKARARARASFSAATLRGLEGDVDAWSMPASIELRGVDWSDSRVQRVELKLSHGTEDLEDTIDDVRVLADQLRSVRVVLGDGTARAIRLSLRLATSTEREFTLDVAIAAEAGARTVDLLQVSVQPRGGELAARLQADAMHFNRAIWASTSAYEYATALNGKRFRDLPVLDHIDPVPVAISGTSVGFRWHAMPDDLREWMAAQRGTAAMPQVVAMPTGGVFGEAVLGRAVSAEKLDMTRFWNWQDSPIPFAAPSIAALQAGSRATPVDLQGAGFADAIVALQAMADLPDPTGLAAVLGAIAQGGMFRDMSGLAETIELARTQGALASQGAAHAGTQAGSNFATAAQFASELLQSAMSLAASAAAAGAGVPLPLSGPGKSNISNAGAAYNIGEALDARDAAAAAGAAGGNGAGRDLGVGGAGGSGALGPAAALGVGTGGATAASAARRAFDAVLGDGASFGASATPAPTAGNSSPSGGVPGSAGGEGTDPGQVGEPSEGGSFMGGGAPPLSFLPGIQRQVLPGPGVAPSSPVPAPPAQLEFESQLRAEMNRDEFDDEAAEQIAGDWFDRSVLPLLGHAVTDDQYLPAAMNQYLDWLASAQLLGVDVRTGIARRDAQARDTAEVALRQALATANARMAQTNDIRYVYDMRSWIAAGTMLGFDLDLAEAVSSSSLRVVVEDLALPDIGNGISAPINVIARLSIGPHQPLPTPLDVAVTVTGGTADPAVGRTTAVGAFATSITRTTDADPLVVTVAAAFRVFPDADISCVGKATVRID